MITIYWDLETGGTEPQHPTIQLAAIAVDGGKELGAFEQKITFDEAACDPKALEMNHYTRSEWLMAMPGPIVASRFAAWLKPYSDIERISKAGNPYRVARGAGYNVVAFDWPRLRQLFGAQFLPIDYLQRDVLQRVLFYCDEHGEAPGNFKLTTVAEWLGLPVDGAHDALFDVRLTAQVHRTILWRASMDEITQW